MAKIFQKLTRQEMRKLSACEKIIEHGIAFERMGNGDGTFSINIMADRVRVHRVIGRESDGTTRTQAEEFIEKIRRDCRDDRLGLPKGRKTSLGFREAAAKQYILRMHDEGGKGIKRKHHILDLHLVPFFGDTPIGRLTSSDVERFKKHGTTQRIVVRKERKDQYGKKIPAETRLTHTGTVNRNLAVLSHLLNKAVEWRWISYNPVKIRLFREGKGRIAYLTVEQISRPIRSRQTGSKSSDIFIYFDWRRNWHASFGNFIHQACAYRLKSPRYFYPQSKGWGTRTTHYSSYSPIFGKPPIYGF